MLCAWEKVVDAVRLSLGYLWCDLCTSAVKVLECYTQQERREWDEVEDGDDGKRDAFATAIWMSCCVPCAMPAARTRRITEGERIRENIVMHFLHRWCFLAHICSYTLYYCNHNSCNMNVSSEFSIVSIVDIRRFPCKCNCILKTLLYTERARARSSVKRKLLLWFFVESEMEWGWMNRTIFFYSEQYAECRMNTY